MVYYVPPKRCHGGIPPWTPKQKQSSLAPGFSWSRLDPVQECENNVAMVNALWGVAKRLTSQTDLVEAIKRQDAVVSQDLIRRAILGA